PIIDTTGNAAFALPPPPTAAEKAANSEYQSARKLYKAEDYQHAIPAFEKFIAAHKASDSQNIFFQVVCAMNHAGSPAYKSKDYTTAQKFFDQAIAATAGNTHPGFVAQSAMAHRFLALSLNSLGKTNEAMLAHQTIIKTFKDSKKPRFQSYALESMLAIADHYRQTKRAAEAIPYYQNIRDLGPKIRSRNSKTLQYMARFRLAHAYLEAGQNDKAKAAFESFVTTYKNHDKAFIQERVTKAKAELAKLG
ncbi:MAG: tetratricopeptide repeat protein, partial [Cohaesibacter sp.]|nr:tetratricopeptide repeat protein [Cohaesibacter sp.]